MAKRLIDTEMWKKPWYRKLKAGYKCFWHYLLSNCNHAGIWEVDFDLASFQIGENIKEMTAREIFRDQVLIFDNGRKWLIMGFVRFQYGEKLNEKSPVHKKVIDYLKGIHHNGHTLYDTLLHRVLNRVKEEEKEEEEDKEEEKEEEGGVGSEYLSVEVWPSFEDFWNLYDKKEDRVKCEKKWSKLKQREKEQIMQHLPGYIASTPVKQYRKNPLTYLNANAWENEIIDAPTGWNTMKSAHVNSSSMLQEHFKNESAG